MIPKDTYDLTNCQNKLPTKPSPSVKITVAKSSLNRIQKFRENYLVQDREKHSSSKYFNNFMNVLAPKYIQNELREFLFIYFFMYLKIHL